MTWWYWLVLGLALTALEIATPGGFFVIFFGLSAFAVGLLTRADLAGPAWVQWLLFPVVAVGALAVFRQPLLRWMRAFERQGEVDSLVGEIAVPAGDIPPGGYGRAELRGSSWSVRNVDTITLFAGKRCRVVAVDGLMLDLRQE
jgi:inner membrane protein